MRKQLLKSLVFCAAGLALAAQGQTSPGSSSGSSSQSSQSPYGATGRMSHQEIRASKLTGAEVKGSSGETLGTLNDIIINPASGKIDFAVLSLTSSSSSASSSSTSGTSGTSGTTSTTTPGASSSTGGGSSPGGLSSGSSATGEKLVALPWTLLRPSSTGGTSMEQPSFTFTGDKSKLDSAPSFSQSNWPDISQPSWRHSIFSYFGMTPGSATGAGETPGGSSSGGSSGSSSDTSKPGSSGTP